MSTAGGPIAPERHEAARILASVAVGEVIYDQTVVRTYETTSSIDDVLARVTEGLAEHGWTRRRNFRDWVFLTTLGPYADALQRDDLFERPIEPSVAPSDAVRAGVRAREGFAVFAHLHWWEGDRRLARLPGSTIYELNVDAASLYNAAGHRPAPHRRRYRRDISDWSGSGQRVLSGDSPWLVDERGRDWLDVAFVASLPYEFVDGGSTYVDPDPPQLVLVPALPLESTAPRVASVLDEQWGSWTWVSADASFFVGQPGDGSARFVGELLVALAREQERQDLLRVVYSGPVGAWRDGSVAWRGGYDHVRHVLDDEYPYGGMNLPCVSIHGDLPFEVRDVVEEAKLVSERRSSQTWWVPSGFSDVTRSLSRGAEVRSIEAAEDGGLVVDHREGKFSFRIASEYDVFDRDARYSGTYFRLGFRAGR